jgi:hypothetical protein
MYNTVDRVPPRARASWRQPYTLVVPEPLTGLLVAGLRNFQIRHCCPQITAERLGGPGMISSVVATPCAPDLEQLPTLDGVTRCQDASLSEEGADWAGEISQFLHRLFGGCGLDEVPSLGEPIPAFHRPDQHAG